jgi:hypothetical protein
LCMQACLRRRQPSTGRRFLFLLSCDLLALV